MSFVMYVANYVHRCFSDLQQGEALEAIPQIVSQFLGTCYESFDRTLVTIVKGWVVFNDSNIRLARGGK